MSKVDTARWPSLPRKPPAGAGYVAILTNYLDKSHSLRFLDTATLARAYALEKHMESETLKVIREELDERAQQENGLNELASANPKVLTDQWVKVVTGSDGKSKGAPTDALVRLWKKSDNWHEKQRAKDFTNAVETMITGSELSKIEKGLLAEALTNSRFNEVLSNAMSDKKADELNELLVAAKAKKAGS